jgi:hypothetical protein
MKAFLFYTISIVFACSSCTREPSLCGDYEIKPKKVFDKLFTIRKGVDSRIVGSELKLMEDSSFTYVTCGNIMKGRWQKSQHYVFLHVTANRFRKDSLNSIMKAAIHEKPLVFTIDKGKLYRIVEDKEKKRKVLELLSKR